MDGTLTTVDELMSRIEELGWPAVMASFIGLAEDNLMAKSVLAAVVERAETAAVAVSA